MNENCKNSTISEYTKGKFEKLKKNFGETFTTLKLSKTHIRDIRTIIFLCEVHIKKNSGIRVIGLVNAGLALLELAMREAESVKPLEVGGSPVDTILNGLSNE